MDALNLILMAIFLIFEPKNVIANIYIQEDNVPGKITKTMEKLSQMQCVLKCEKIHTYATFTQTNGGKHICNCFTPIEDGTAQSSYSVYKRIGQFNSSYCNYLGLLYTHTK